MEIEQKQPPVNQPTQPTPPASTKKFPWLQVMFGVMMLGAVGFLGWQNWQLRQEVKQLIAQSSTPTTQPSEVTPTPFESNTPSPTTDTTAEWKVYRNEEYGFSFKYPENMGLVIEDVSSNIFEANEEYWVHIGGSDITYLEVYLYKNTQSPQLWWKEKGKNIFDKIAEEVSKVSPKKTQVSLNYSEKEINFLNKRALRVIVSSSYQSPYTPSERYLTVFQNNGYVIMISYSNQETQNNSIEISQKILSTFKFLK